jgi:protein TIF31
MQGKSEGSTLEFTLIDPNGISYPIRLSPADSPIDLKAYLSDFAALSYYTNYQLETDNRVLQDYIELSEQSVSNTVHMVLKPYNDRAFKQHLKRLSDILSHPPSSFSHVIPVAKETSQELDSTPEKVIPAFNMESLVLQPGKILTPPSAWCPFTAEEDSLEIPQCLQSVSLSEYNPPNSKRLIQGDLGYIVARTTEGNVLHITSAVNGFYINATDTAKGLFRPEPTAELITGKTLVELLCNASPSFKTSWNKLITIGCEWNNIRFLSSVLPTPCWIIEKPEEYAKKENLSVRDWNEEFQMIRSLPTETPFQRIQRDKALGKIYSDFLDVAIQGAKAVVIGSVQPLNPMDPMKQQLFVFNHIFFSFTEDLEYVVSFIQ